MIVTRSHAVTFPYNAVLGVTFVVDVMYDSICCAGYVDRYVVPIMLTFAGFLTGDDWMSEKLKTLCYIRGMCTKMGENDGSRPPVEDTLFNL